MRATTTPTSITNRFFFCPLVIALALSLASATAASAAEEKEQASEQEKSPSEFDLKKPLNGSDGVDFVCETSVFYTWQTHPVPKTRTSDRRNPRSNRTTVTTPPPKKTEVFFTKVGEQGLSGIDVKKRLESRLPAIKAQALSACRRLHENQAACVASGIKSNASEYDRMDYASRKALLTAITKQCSNDAGDCLTAQTKEIECFLNRPPDVPQEAEGKGKDKKGKKGKK